MGPRQLEAELHLVLCPIIVRRHPRIRTMAEVAAAAFEDSLMRVYVAGNAILVLRPWKRTSDRSSRKPEVQLVVRPRRRGMTSHAFRSSMPTHQGETRDLMVESGFHGKPVHPVPSRRGVALAAVALHSAVVRILVARRAPRGFHRDVSNRLTLHP